MPLPPLLLELGNLLNLVGPFQQLPDDHPALAGQQGHCVSPLVVSVVLSLLNPSGKGEPSLSHSHHLDLVFLPPVLLGQRALF